MLFWLTSRELFCLDLITKVRGRQALPLFNKHVPIIIYDCVQLITRGSFIGFFYMSFWLMVIVVLPYCRSKKPFSISQLI